jgi:glycosyltransferase involved in cell wall biosynthesis
VGCDLIHAIHIGLVYSTEIALAAARAKDLPFVFTPFPHQGGWEGRRFRRLYSSSDALIAMTHTEKEWLANRGADPERVYVCGGGPMLAETGSGVRFRERFDLTGPIVLFVGQRLKHKGYSELIAAMPTVWTQHPDARLVFIGPMTPEAQPIFAEAIRDSRVIDLGTVDIQTKTDALDACTMLCVPSTQESLGLVYIEAWAHNKPVIAGDTDVTREVIDVGEDGLLVPQTSSDVARAILQLLNCPHRAAQMGQRGRSKLEHKYSWGRLSERMIDIYSTAISANSHRSP